MKTAFLGLGGMGHGMAANLDAAGLLAAVYNRTSAVAERFAADRDIAVCGSPGATVEHAEVLVLCVSEDTDVLAVVDALVPALSDRHTVIDCSTVSSDTAQDAATRVGERGAAFVDAPVSGGTEGAANGSLSIMVGGDSTVVEYIQPVLHAMGTRITHMGGTGAGQATKAVNQVMAAGVNRAVCEALHFARALDLPLERVVDVVSGGAASNWLVINRGKTMVADSYDPGFKIKHHYKDLSICRHMAAQIEGELPLTDATWRDYAALIDAGYGDSDISALYQARGVPFTK